MVNDYLNIIKELKSELSEDGFIIEGVFGSRVREDYTEISDLDILYEIEKNFRDKYKGFKAIARIDNIRDFLSAQLNVNVDLVQKSTLNPIGRKYILPELVNVR